MLESPPIDEAAHALFEEARRRTRRRRRRWAAISVGLVLGTVVAVSLVTAGGTNRKLTDAARHPTTRSSPTLFVQLLKGREPIAVVDVAARTVRVARTLRTMGGDPLRRLFRSGDRLVYYGAGGIYAVDLDLRGRPQRLGPSSSFFPSATEGRVWLVGRDSMVETTVRGRVTFRSRRRAPCHGPIVAAMKHALLCQGTAGLRAFDPATGRVLRRVPGPFPLATTASLVASCEARCGALRLTNIATGRKRAIRPPAGYRFVEGYDGAFSPDGSLLAVPLRRGRSWEVALVDVPSGMAHPVDGARLAGDYGKFAWSSAGELFFTSPRGTLTAYRPGSRRARALPLELGAPILDLAAN